MSLFRSAFQKLWLPSNIIYISMNINIRNMISFFEFHWDMNMQLVPDQIYYKALRACSYPNATQKFLSYFLNMTPYQLFKLSMYMYLNRVSFTSKSL